MTSKIHATDYESAIKLYLSTEVGGKDAHALWHAGQRIEDPERRSRFYGALIQDIEAIKQAETIPPLLEHADTVHKYARTPVGIKTFIESPDYLNKYNQVYPKVMEHLVECNSGKYNEVVFTGGIGSGKTTAALYSMAYQLYLLSCMHNPQRTFGLDSSSEILFVFQSLNAKLAKALDYNRFRSMIEESPYFQQHFPFKKDIESKLIFPNRIEVVPVSGQETATIGQNVISCLLDEVNYMQVVEKSAKSVDQGTFNQADALYNSVARRRKSRFASKGKLPGLICLVSSKRYPGQFTDKKEEEALNDIATKGHTDIYIYDKRVWQIAPEGRFDPARFSIFIGDLGRKPRVLEDWEIKDFEHEKHMVMEIPYEYRTDFDDDIINALREIAGVSTLARHPFMVKVDKVSESAGKSSNVLADTWVDFKHKNTKLIRKNIINPQHPRYAHIDLGLTGDSAGVAIGHVPQFERIQRGENIEILPVISYDMVLEVRPPANDEINFERIRQLLYTLRKNGLPIRWVSLDSFQSVDTIQILRANGFMTGNLSMDKTRLPYEILKTGIYDGRVWLPENEHLMKELVSLEDIPGTGKIDHPPNGSKDCSDSVAGVAYGLTMRREIWHQHGISASDIPASVKAGPQQQLKEKEQGYYALSLPLKEVTT